MTASLPVPPDEPRAAGGVGAGEDAAAAADDTRPAAGGVASKGQTHAPAKKPRAPRKKTGSPARTKKATGTRSSAPATEIEQHSDVPPTPPKPPLPVVTGSLPDGSLDGVVVPPRPPLPVDEGAAAPMPDDDLDFDLDITHKRLPARPNVPDEPDEPNVPDKPDVPDQPDDRAATDARAGDDAAVATDVPAEIREPLVGAAEQAVGQGPEESAPVLEPSPSTHPVSRTPAVRIRGVVKSFGGTAAVDGIDLTVPAGTFYGLVGPNGAGKTTTLSIISGLLAPDRGEVEVVGIDARRHPREVKRLMGVLPDRLRTFDRLTGRQLLYYTGVLRGLDAAIVDARITDLARAFDIAEALGRAVSDYSAGMTKKVMLAGALIHSPRLLVLDEPFEAVDPVSSTVILDILRTYVDHGGTVILSSHGLELIERVCARVAVIVAGRVLAEGTIEQVRGELTLEERFARLAGGLSDVEGLEWLHGFSD